MNATIRLALVSASVVLCLSSCKPRERGPNEPVPPVGPDSGRAAESLRYTSCATCPSGDVSLRFAWGDGDTSDWSGFVGSGESVAAPHAWDTAGSYDITAQARDVRGLESDWSMAKTARIGPANRAPDAPWHIDGPFEGHRFRSYEFSANARDPDGDSVSVRFDWGDGDTSGWSSYVGSGKSVSMAHAWDGIATFAVSAQARDRLGAKSPWCEAIDYSIGLADTIVAWYFTGGHGDYFSCPAISTDGTIYLTSRNCDSLYALTSDGAVKWRLLFGDQSSSDPVIGPDGTVYVTSVVDHRVAAVDPAGVVRWTYEVELGVASDGLAVASHGTVYVVSGGGALIAINPDGTTRWQYHTGDVPSRFGTSRMPAVGADGTVYFSSQDSGLFAVSADSTLNWIARIGRVWSATAIGSDGALYFVGDSAYLHALNGDGSVRWRCPINGEANSAPSIGADGTLCLSVGQEVWAIRPDGTVAWRAMVPSGARYQAPAVAADGTIYVGSEQEGLFALDGGGAVKWSFDSGSRLFSSPSIGPDGTVYVGDEDGFWALRGTAPLADSPWPKFHHDLRNTGRVGGR